jgi:hypothetical protein
MKSLGEAPTDQRAVSDIVGVALLIAMAILGATLVVVIGGNAMQDLEQESRVEVAQQSLREVSSRLEQLNTGGNERVTSFELPDDMTGTLGVQRQTSVNLTAMTVATPTNPRRACTTGDIGIGTIIYENENDIIGYEAGGVWRGSESGGSVMVSPPELQYRNGRLGMSMSEIAGHMGDSDRITARINRSFTTRMSANMTQALIRDETVQELHSGGPGPVKCNPGRLNGIWVNISGSQFATAWHQYAHRNFDDRRVTVLPGENADVSAGDTVRMYFMLGQTASANFEVTDMDAVSTSRENQDVTVDVTIENTGDLGGTADIDLGLRNVDNTPPTQEGPSPYDTDSVTLDGGDSTTLTFTLQGAHLQKDGPASNKYTNYTYEIDTGDEVASGDLLIGSASSDPADFDVQSITAPANAELGDVIDADVVVVNDGDMPTTETIQYNYSGSTYQTRNVPLNGGESTTLQFPIPTTQEGEDIPLNASVADQGTVGGEPNSENYEETTIDIGDSPVFQVSHLGSPTAIAENTEFEVNATITNVGDVTGSLDVGIWVQNASTGNNVTDSVTTETIPGTLATAGGGEADVNMTVTGGVSPAGEYELVVSTPNETRTRNIYVGQSAQAYYVVTAVDGTPDPVEQDGDLNLRALINNTGSAADNQDIEFYWNTTAGETGSESPYDTISGVSILPGDGTTVEISPNTINIDPNQAPGTYPFTVVTEDTKLEGDVRIEENVTGSAIGGGGGNTITINENITARLQILGTALTGSDPDDYVIRSPIEMAVFTNNETHPNEYHYLWGQSTDLNTPQSRLDQINEEPYLNQTIRVAAGTNLSVYAESFYCDWVAGPWWNEYLVQETSIDRDFNNNGVYADSYRCADRDGSRIDINQNENTRNLVILGDDDSVPNFQQASPDQRSAADILGPLIDGSGRLDLNSNQRVLLYELSERNADPANANQPGDPDYNDAVVIFEVVNHTTTVSPTQPADFEITDTDGPAQVIPPTSETIDVTVNNTGDATNDTDVTFYLDGSVQATQNIALDGGENGTLQFAIPNTISSGLHNATLQLQRDPSETAQRNFYVGNQPQQSFVVNVVNFTRTAEPGGVISLNASVTNVGGDSGNQTIWTNRTGSTGGVTVSDDKQDWPAGGELELASGETKQHEFEFYPGPDDVGTLDLTLSSDNSSVTVTVDVRTDSYRVDRVTVGATAFGEGETIISTDLDSINAQVTNPYDVEGSHQVRIELWEGGTESGMPDYTYTTPNPVVLADETELVTLPLNSYSDETGYYAYNASVDGADNPDSYQTGYIQITDDASQSNTPTASSDLISVNMNQIQLGTDD